jgi:calcium-dependent protein kinase
LFSGYKKILGVAEAEEEVNKIMQQVDKNNSGAIDYSG